MPIQQKMVPVYATTDGKQYYDKGEALRQQTAIDNTAAINNYMEEAELNQRTRATVRNHILGFLAYNAQNNLDNEAPSELNETA